MASCRTVRIRPLISLTLGLALTTVFLWAQAPPGGRNAAPALRVSGPYVYAGFDLYLVHGSDASGDRKIVPLADALEQGKIVVRETSNVSQLTVENTSSEEVYIQAGDIVKGGKQDRVLATDLVLKPRSGPVPIASHCVEQGRWRSRDGEASDRFASSKQALNSNALKIANHRGSQAEVWRNVQAAQESLARKLRTNVRSSISASSLQLTLENEHVRAGVEGYVKAFSPLVQAHNDVVGYAFAVDGRLKSADVYASRALFVKLWPKMLRAAATEALAERTPATAHTPPAIESVRSFLSDARQGRVTEKSLGAEQNAVVRETDEDLIVETRDVRRDGRWIHRNYIRK
ncbi:MAG: hypothetical protein JXO72_12730 [Vicinamibacteria bacterium]|nr:hypothetical protein [Vicinamibacteria bacterium]